MSNPKISVIVPVYNVEKYLPRCIDSILKQTFTDFELLLIDDGSKDNSGNICDEYAKKDNRIKVYHKENGGVSSARNLGIINAKGKNIIYIDGDDYFLQNALETLITWKYELNTNICVGNFYIENQNKRSLFCHGRTRIVKNNFCSWYFHTCIPRAGTMLCDTDILKKHLFDETLCRYEDAKSLFDILRENRINYLSIPVMVYSLDDPGLSGKVKDISTDYIFSLNFEKKSLWEKLVLANLVNQGFVLYPEHRDILKRKYSRYKLFLLIENIISFYARIYRKVKNLKHN